MAYSTIMMMTTTIMMKEGTMIIKIPYLTCLSYVYTETNNYNSDFKWPTCGALAQLETLSKWSMACIIAWKTTF